MTASDPADARPAQPAAQLEWTDSHCHIHDERIPDGPDGAVAAAADMGVSTLVTVGCDRTTSLAAIDVASRHDGVFATIGLHPHDAVNIQAVVELLHDRVGLTSEARTLSSLKESHLVGSSCGVCSSRASRGGIYIVCKPAL